MIRFDTEFEVLEVEGRVIGFSLVARPQTEAEIFCATFPAELAEGDAEICFENDEIVFSHPNCQYQGRCAHKVEPDKLEELKKLLSGDSKLSLQRAGVLTPGFKIVLP